MFHIDPDQCKIGPFGIIYSEVTHNHSILEKTTKTSNLVLYPYDTYSVEYFQIPINFNKIVVTNLDIYPSELIDSSQLLFNPSFLQQVICVLFIIGFISIVFSN